MNEFICEALVIHIYLQSLYSKKKIEEISLSRSHKSNQLQKNFTFQFLTIFYERVKNFFPIFITLLTS